MARNPHAVYSRELTPLQEDIVLAEQEFCAVTVTRLDVAGALGLRFGYSSEPVTVSQGQTWVFRQPEERLAFDVLINSPGSFFELVVAFGGGPVGVII